MPSFLYDHIVSFEETNALGNVYFTNFLKWQGICRELFLKERAPELLPQLSGGMKIATLHCSCSYYWELYAFDRVVVEMYLNDSSESGKSLESGVLWICFKYWKNADPDRLLVGEGEQKIAFMYPTDGTRWERGPIPDSLQNALVPYGFIKAW